MGLDGRLDLATTIPQILGREGPPSPTAVRRRSDASSAVSQRAGMRCTVVRSGMGFLFGNKGAARVGP